MTKLCYMNMIRYVLTYMYMHFGFGSICKQRSLQKLSLEKIVELLMKINCLV